MSNIFGSYETGHNLYFTVTDTASNMWNGFAFVPKVDNDWTTYAFPFTEAITGEYEGTFPSGIPIGVYCLIAFVRNGTMPMVMDVPVLFGIMNWDGSHESSGGGGNKETFMVTLGEYPNYKISSGVKSNNAEATITPGVK